MKGETAINWAGAGFGVVKFRSASTKIMCSVRASTSLSYSLN
jgi:hypothetical protein